MDNQVVLALYHWVAARSAISHLVTLVAEGGPLPLLLALAACWLWPGAGRPIRRRAVLAAAASLALAGLLGVALSSVTLRPRPFVALAFAPLFSHGVDPSFPSSHTLFAVALAGPVLWLRPRIGVWLVLWSLAIGFARVAAGVHYPSDIVGSALLAAGPTVLGLLTTRPLLSRIPPLDRLVAGRAGLPRQVSQ